MVLIGGIKYACERCIRGHRVTTCNHTDQPLMMIKPKGRPSSQCKHCKDMRKNRNSHSTGACTCGKKRGGVTKTCCCETGKTCTCHGKRKPVETVKEEEEKKGKVRQIGMDPLAAAKPATEKTRTRVGEVSVPLNEYIPANQTGIGSVNDKLPEGFFQDVPLPFEPGHGLLDLFSDSSEQQKNNRSSTSSLSPENIVRSPTEGITDFFPYFPMSSTSSNNSNIASLHSTSAPLPQRTGSISSNESSSTRPSLALSDSMDSLLTNSNNVNTNNFHHYDSMIHKPPVMTKRQTEHAKDTLFGTFERDLQQHHHRTDVDSIRTNNNLRDDQSSRSVEVLSLTPTFMDIPTDFKDGYFDTSSKKQSHHTQQTAHHLQQSVEQPGQQQQQQQQQQQLQQVRNMDPFASLVFEHL